MERVTRFELATLSLGSRGRLGAMWSDSEGLANQGKDHREWMCTGIATSSGNRIAVRL